MWLNNYSDRHDLLLDWLIDSTPPGSSILDIGANDGTFCPQVQRVARHARHFAGVDPDVEKLERNSYLHERFFGTLEEADIPSEAFDAAYSIYVLEHVDDAERFMRSLSRVLKPGGSFYFITPNGNHYFAKIASFLQGLRLQGSVLTMVRPTHLVSRYHYPALYRLNSPTVISDLGRLVGMSRAEFRYSERIEELECYFPGPTKAFPRIWEALVERLGRESLLGNLMGRLTKDES